MFKLIDDSVKEIVTLEPDAITFIALDEVTRQFGETDKYADFTLTMIADPVEFEFFIHLKLGES